MTPRTHNVLACAHPRACGHLARETISPGSKTG